MPGDCQKRKLDRAVKIMLSGDEIDGFPHILSTINRLLHQCRLQGFKTAEEVFNETYLRAVKKIDSGDIMPNIPAWFRTTAFNVIREWSRTEIRQSNLVSVQSPEPIYLSSSQLDIIAMIDAFERLLTASEQKLLQLRALGLTWEEVAQQLVQDGDESDQPSLPQMLAKRASRARQRMEVSTYISY